MSKQFQLWCVPVNSDPDKFRIAIIDFDEEKQSGKIVANVETYDKEKSEQLANLFVYAPRMLEHIKNFYNNIYDAYSTVEDYQKSTKRTDHPMDKFYDEAKSILEFLNEIK